MAETSTPTMTDEEIGQQMESSRQLHEKKYLRPKEIAAYCLATYGQKTLDEFIKNNMQFFMLNFLRISGKSYANISIATKIYDAVDDSISGVIVDRTRTRWGHLMPYLIAPMPLWALSSLMIFTAPELSNAGRILWAAAAMLLNGLGFSYYNSWNIILYSITPNVSERNNLITIQKFVELFIIIPSMLPIALSLLPKISPAFTMKNIYTFFVALCVAFAAVSAIFAFRNVRERVPLVTKEEMNKIKLKDTIRELLKNKPMFVVIIADFVNGVKSVGGSSESFFWLNNMGSLLYGTLCGVFTGSPNYFMTPLAPVIIKKFGARATAIFCGLFGGTAYLILWLVGFKPFGEGHLVLNLAWVYFALTVCGLPNCVMRVVNPIIRGDVYDYMEWKSGLRNEALVNAICTWFGKLGDSVTGWLSGYVFYLIGYAPKTDLLGNLVPISDEKLLAGIFAVFALAPSIARYGYGISHIFFSIHGDFKKQMELELDERRAKRTAEKAEEMTSEN